MVKYLTAWGLLFVVSEHKNYRFLPHFFAKAEGCFSETHLPYGKVCGSETAKLLS